MEGRGSVKAGNRNWKIENRKVESRKSKVESQETSGREQKAAPTTARKESGQSVTLEIVEVQVEGKTKPHT
jgi:uncharacterized protein YaaQ